MSRKIMSAFLFCVFAVCVRSSAQENTLLQRIQKANDFSNVAYHYVIRLLDTRKNAVTDSITGHYVQANGAFSDSSSAALTILSGGYYCSIDHERKEVDVYNIQALEKRSGKKTDQKKRMSALAKLPEMDKADVKTDSTELLYKVSCTLKNSPGMLTYMEARRSDYRVVLLRYETPDNADDPGHYLRVCTITDLVYSVQPIVNRSSVFTIQGKTVLLTAKYRQYKLSAITE